LANGDKLISLTLPLEISKLPENIAYLYFQITTPGKAKILLNQSKVLAEGEITQPKFKLTLVSPTYKREDYIYKNIENFRKWKDKLFFIRWIIVDNGQSLKEFFDNKDISLSTLQDLGIYIVPNRNLGGTGGFARGLYEIFHNELFIDTTHIGFMDDDAQIEWFTFERVKDFLKFAKNKNLGIGAPMLEPQTFTIVHESGALYRKKKPHILNRKNSLDLKKKEDLKEFLKEPYWNYWAWWFLILKKDIVEQVGYPFPYFFKADDIEYGYRLKSTQIPITDLTGVYVYHSLKGKLSPFIHYLASFNELIFRTLYYENTWLKEVKECWRQSILNLFAWRYEYSEYLLKAYEDFLQGTSFFETVKPDEYYISLAKKANENVSKNIPKEDVFISDQRVLNPKKSKLKTFLHFLTLGSHLIPTINKDLILRPIHGGRWDILFGGERVINYDPTTEMGFYSQKNRKRFFKILLKIIKIGILFSIKYPLIKRELRKKHTYLTSEEFWKKYMGL
jgi:galactofuranosylgalactofuranosylrhamnosyl-N-acetylglucosaminyl-diphospho-decaprenol beta-1,5/1,6-galactofuranosyltransferase